MKSKVYFTKEINPSSLVKLYNELGIKLEGKVAVKVHSGEKGNQNFLKPSFMKEIINYVNGTVVECNTAYEGSRDTTEKHIETMKTHGWSDLFNIDILDSKEDIELSIPDGKVIKKNYVGKNIENYDSLLILSHFKGHPMGGYGGALKQLSIGFASSKGKRYIHCVGKENGTYEDMFKVNQDKFLEAMADSASSITELFKDKIAYINVMANMSVDCDCCAEAENPKIKDIGILASLDPVALDQACIDLVYNSSDEGKKDLINRIESRNGIHTIETAYNLGIGFIDYEFINID